ncbi:MAG: hypothetical protein H6625_13010 [Bdellovibrionaceae bacterium]|nr:hypothetical protein [Pseudobdellovibrionaceae bacterium]
MTKDDMTKNLARAFECLALGKWLNLSVHTPALELLCVKNITMLEHTHRKSWVLPFSNRAVGKTNSLKINLLIHSNTLLL